MILMPVFVCLSLHFGIGDQLKGLVLGVVNDETSSCFTSRVDWFGCELKKFSCRYLEEFDQSAAELVKENLKLESSFRH
jgi:hypothetical protein